MSKKILLLFFLSAGYFTVSAQMDTAWYPKLFLKPSAGINFPVTKLLEGKPIDNLIAFNDNNTVYWQFPAASLFFNRHWGIEFNYSGSSSGKRSAKSEAFNNYLTDTYDNYYLADPLPYSGKIDKVYNDIERIYLGVVYKMEMGRILLMPKISGSITSFFTDTKIAYLKEKKTNLILEVFFDPGKSPRDHFSLAPGFTIAYKLSERFMLNFDLVYTSYKTNITFIETITDLNSGAVINEGLYNYSKRIKTVSAGGGLIIVLNLKPG
jgi:hypothetical protein